MFARALPICLSLLLAPVASATALVPCVDTQGRAVLVAPAAVPALRNYRCERSVAAADDDASARRALGLSAERAAPAATGALRLVPIAGTGQLRLPDLPSPTDPAPPTTWDALIEDAARRYDHDSRLLRAIIRVESNFDATAVSPKGAIGLMQVMPETGRELGVDDPKARLFDPAVNVQAGAKLLRRLMDRFPRQPELALAAYNAGEGAVMRHGGQVPPFRETQDYVQRVLALYERYRGR